MVDTDKLRGIIAEKGYSQRKLAEELKLNETTFYRKMQRAVFDSDEIYAMIQILGIKNPTDIFFARAGA